MSFSRLMVFVAVQTLLAAAPSSMHAQPCTFAPLGMQAWWTGDDCGPSDLLGNHDGMFLGLPECGLDPKVGPGHLRIIPPGPMQPATYVVVPHSIELDPTSDGFTADAWVRTTRTGIAPVVSKGCPGIGGYTLALVDGVLNFTFCDAMHCYLVNGTQVLNDGDWHHVAAVIDATAGSNSFAIFVNGVEEARVDVGIDFVGGIGSTDDLFIGASPTNGPPDFFWSGGIDELEIFNRPLAESEIHGIFAAGPSGKCKALGPDCCDPCALSGLLAPFLPGSSAGSTTNPCLTAPPVELATDACCETLSGVLPNLPGSPGLPSSHPCNQGQ